MKCPKCKGAWKDGRCGVDGCPGRMEVSTWAENACDSCDGAGAMDVWGPAGHYGTADCPACKGTGLKRESE